MSAALYLFEDRHWRDLRPLTDTLPVPALAFGASSLGERLSRAAALPIAGVLAREDALAAWRDGPQAPARSPGVAQPVVILNAAALPGPWLAAAREERSPALLAGDGRIAGARLPFGMLVPGLARGADVEDFLRELGLPEVRCDAAFVRFPWHLIERNADAIASDLSELDAARAGEVHPAAVLLDPGRIHVAAGARVEPLAVIDARPGPVRIGEGALVRSHTVVTGPCVVGAGTQLLGGFVARSTFGPECRIAGEVEESVWQGYANKRHHGFVGHSAIGEWVNLGALTTTSDLKNNYGSVRVWVDGRELDSGSPKVGAVIGAHAKTGIGTLLPTGASIGVGANLFGGGRFAPKRTPAFGWWDGDAMTEHRPDRFLATARIALSRRGRELSAAEQRALETLFAATAKERRGG